MASGCGRERWSRRGDMKRTLVAIDPGKYVWNYDFPCGDSHQEFGGPMQTRGWMAGTFEVV
jgi:hypothetical protein